jgi:hypothetical protein
MKNLIVQNFNGDHIMLTVCIWYANIDFIGLTDYAVKAIIGGIIWFGFKLASEYFANWIKNRKTKGE